MYLEGVENVVLVQNDKKNIAQVDGREWADMWKKHYDDTKRLKS